MKNFDYSKSDISKALTDVGITTDDNIFVHSNIGYFGKMENAENKNDYCREFLESVLDVIGINGTLVVPTFSYSFCNNEVYDKIKTDSVCGIFSEYIRKKSNSSRSDDPNFSIAAIGKNAGLFTKDCAAYSFGKNSFWERFHRKDGKICNFNLDSSSTFIHYVEKSLNVEYRYDKPFSGTSIINGKQVELTFFHFVYDLNKKSNAPYFKKFDHKVGKLGMKKTSQLGKGQIISINSKDVFEIIKKELVTNPDFLIVGN